MNDRAFTILFLLVCGFAMFGLLTFVDAIVGMF